MVWVNLGGFVAFGGDHRRSPALRTIRWAASQRTFAKREVANAPKTRRMAAHQIRLIVTQ